MAASDRDMLNKAENDKCGVKTNTDDVDRHARAVKKKTEQAKKHELIREIHKLGVQIQALEKDKLIQVLSKRSDFQEELGPLEEEETKLAAARRTEKVKVHQQLDKMKHLIKRFQAELRQVKPSPDVVEKLKVMMEEIEGTIQSFKEPLRVKYEDLMRSERTLSLELQQLERKFEAWNQSSKTDQPAAPLPPSSHLATVVSNISQDLPPEVTAFDKFVHQSGGHQGGWDEEDHQTFLRYRNMYKGRILFLDHVRPLLPTHTEADIRQHESWLQEYLFLYDSKKSAIKMWRERKEEEKDDAISQLQVKLEVQGQRLDQPIMSAQEKAEKLKQINAWKVQKELEKEIKKEQKLREELERKRQQNEDRKQQLEMKRKVEEFKQQKQIEEEVLSMIEEEKRQEEDERKKEIIAREIGRFRNRDMRILNDKLEKEKEKEEKRKERERRIEAIKIQVEVNRDPDRLLKPTAGWNERLKSQDSSSCGQLYTIPHRAIPSWRQGLL